MQERFDVVVAGGGHNSLIASAYLSRAGYRCLVLEARDVPGGDAATEELVRPGFWADTCSTAHNVLQASPVIRDDELGLRAEYGLTYLHPDPVVHVPFPDGASVTQWRDPDRTAESIAALSPRDAGAYLRLLAEYDEVKGAFAAHRRTPIGWGPDLTARLDAHPSGHRWRRRMMASAWDVVGGAFAHPQVQAFLLWMAMMTMQAVDRPGTGTLAYSLVYGRQRHSWTLPQGGSGSLPLALTRLLGDTGSEVRTGETVTGLVVRDGRCVGVETAAGERHLARHAVLSTIHPKQLLGMAPAGVWDAAFVEGVATWRPGISMFVAHYAATSAPAFATAGGPLAPVAAGIPTSVDRLLRVGSEFTRGVVALDDPVVLVLCPTVADPSRAPEGGHTLKVIGMQPYELPEGPQRWDEIAAEVADANLAHVRRYAPNLTEEHLLGQVVKSPLDLERMNAHNWHGSCHGGDQGPAQSGALRPAPGWASHRTPIPGLYQTGSTTHPGGSVSGEPGRNAAAVLLRDLGSSLEAGIRLPAGTAG